MTRIEVSGFHQAPLPERKPGEHMWVVVSMYRVTDPTVDRVYMDRKSLLSIEGPGCFWCEKKWSAELASQPCG